ncbi:unnamed protein product [Ilex paraguariensis]|uniref:Glutathione S-transferase n=1 Tax=Ilex paraguariensis TaxID=185542 RepID=A0ABC8TGJ9_9AQUA
MIFPWCSFLTFPFLQVPALEHENKIIGESLDIIKYVDSHFEGPALLPDDPAKKEFAEELISYSDTFVKGVFTSFKGDAVKEAGAAFDYLETALHKFDDGPFFLGQKFSLVDIVYAPFLERHQIFFQDVWSYDIRSGRPKIAAFMEEMNKIGAYTQTKCDPKLLVEAYKRMFLVNPYCPNVGLSSLEEGRLRVLTLWLYFASLQAQK